MKNLIPIFFAISMVLPARADDLFAPKGAEFVPSEAATRTETRPDLNGDGVRDMQDVEVEQAAEAQKKEAKNNAKKMQEVLPQLMSGIGGAGQGGKPDKRTVRGGGSGGSNSTCGLYGGVSMDRATENVSQKNIIPTGSGYDMEAGNWPKYSDGGVSFGPSKVSHCTSATATAFLEYISELERTGQLKLTDAQKQFLNGPTFNAIFNGNTYSVALFNKVLGGQNLFGEGASVASTLGQAQPGDVVKFDRDKTGHSTIFKSFDGQRYCYWTSNTKNADNTSGAGTKCEDVGVIKGVAVSRFPSPETIQSGLDRVISNESLFKDTINLPKDSLTWSTSLGNKCESSENGGNSKIDSLDQTTEQEQNDYDGGSGADR